MRGAKLWITAVGAILIVAVVAGSLVRGFSRSTVEVKTAEATTRLFEDKVLATGRVEAACEADLAAPFAARLLKLNVREGDRVSPGQVLGELDTKEAEKRVKEAETALAVAEAELAAASAPATPEELAEAGAALKAAEVLAEAACSKAERTRFLFDQGAVSQVELEAAETEEARARAELEAAAARFTTLKKPDPRKIKTLRARLEQARVALNNACQTVADGRLTAPVAGVVLEVVAREGGFLQPGAIILTIGSADQVRVVTNLNEQDIGGITAGQEAEIQWAGRPGETWRGKVARVAPAVTKSREREMENVVRVYLEFDQESKGPLPLPGATVDVFIYRVKPREALLVPNEAVIEEGKKKYVFNVEKKVARKLAVTVGVGNELFTEIKSGLKPGDRVILNPKDLEDGQPVRAAGGERI